MKLLRQSFLLEDQVCFVFFVSYLFYIFGFLFHFATADLNHSTKNGFAPVHWSSKNGHHVMLEKLLNNLNCDPNQLISINESNSILGFIFIFCCYFSSFFCRFKYNRKNSTSFGNSKQT
jgi:hypothetical protein